MAVIGLIIGAFIFIAHERSVGAAEEQAAQHAADMAWLKEAQDDLTALQAKNAPVVQALDQAEKARALLQQQVALLSKRNETRACLDPDITQQLQCLFPGCPQNGAAKPGGAAARRLRH